MITDLSFVLLFLWVLLDFHIFAFWAGTLASCAIFLISSLLKHFATMLSVISCFRNSIHLALLFQLAFFQHKCLLANPLSQFKICLPEVQFLTVLHFRNV